MDIKTYDEQLMKVKEYHGEVCGGIAIGTKLAMYGMEIMSMELNQRHKNLMVFVETDRCMADAILIVTHCSMGKRAFKQMYYGRFAATFYNIETGEAYRITDVDANKKETKKETKEELVKRFRETPAEELFNVQKVKIVGLKEAQKPGPLHTHTFCSVCGEKIADDQHLVIGGRPICKACALGSYYEIIDE
ncbi:MAG: FmdE family protein [Methanobrevibacter wolinii]